MTLSDHRCNWLITLAFLVAVSLCNHAFAATAADADSLRQRGRYAEAMETYRSLPETEQAATAIGLAYCFAETGRRDDAQRVLKTLLEKEPEHIHGRLLAAELAFERNDFAECRQRLDRLPKITPQPRAVWLAAELDRTQGQFTPATVGYTQLEKLSRELERWPDPRDRHAIALGVWRLAQWQRKSDLFRRLTGELLPQIMADAPDYWQAHLIAAEVFLEKYNRQEALAEISAALAINPNAAAVHLARAKLALQLNNLKLAQRSLDRAGRTNAQLAEAHLLAAQMAIGNLQYDRATTELQAARVLQPKNETVLGTLAAVYSAVDGAVDLTGVSRMGRIVSNVTARNAHGGEFYLALANAFDAMRRFPTAVNFYRQAKQRMPQLIATEGQLGLTYMRLGNEAAARPLLERSFRDDPFNVRIKNMLEVLDVLDGYARLETEHFIIRYDAERDKLLARYAARYLEQNVYPDLIAKLDYPPRHKTLIEFFNTSGGTSGHAWFSARIVGLPYVGTVAACAGRMVAFASPTSGKKYHWARVLRHEFVHIVNLQQTDFRIPHWYTEGLAVWHEGYPRPPEWDTLLRRRVKAGTLYDLTTIDGGFSRPGSSDNWTLAYCQAVLYAQYMVERFGPDAQARLLAAYGDNLDTPRAITRCFGVGQADFERGYTEFIKRLVDKSSPQNSTTLLSTTKRLANAALKSGDRDQLAKHLATLARLDTANVTLRKSLAQLALTKKDFAAARDWATEALYVDVMDVSAHVLLARAEQGSGNLAAAAEEYQTAIELSPKKSDRWRLALARVYVEAQQIDHANRTLREIPFSSSLSPQATELLETLKP